MLYHTPLFFLHSYTFIIKALSYTSFLPPQLHIHHQGSIIHLFSSPTATHSSSRLYHTPLFFLHSYTFIIKALSYTSFLPPQLHIHHQGSIIHLFSSSTATHASSMLYHTPLFFLHSYTFIIKALSYTSFLPPQLHIHHQCSIIHLFSSPTATHSSSRLYHAPLFFPHSYTFITNALSYTSFLPPQLHIHHQGSIIHLFSSPTATHSSSRLYHTPLFFPHKQLAYNVIIILVGEDSIFPIHVHDQSFLDCGNLPPPLPPWFSIVRLQGSSTQSIAHVLDQGIIFFSAVRFVEFFCATVLCATVTKSLKEAVADLLPRD